MLACRWERELGGEDEADVEEIADVAEVYLERYLPEDRELVREILKMIRNSGL